MKITGLIVLIAAVLMFAACQGKTLRPHALTVQGCVAQSNGSFVLTTDEGIKYELTGQQDQVRQMTGHESLVRGELIKSATETQAPSEAGNAAQNLLSVTSIKSVANTCSR